MKYIRYALFKDMSEAQSALQEIQSGDLPNDEIVLVVHRDKLVQGDIRQSESDGNRGLRLGLLCGAVGGLLFGALLAGVHLLPLSIMHAAFFGFLLGIIIGGLGGGLYGSGLKADPLSRLERLRRTGNVLVTAETSGAHAMLEVENIFKRHHAVTAAQ